MNNLVTLRRKEVGTYQCILKVNHVDGELLIFLKRLNELQIITRIQQIFFVLCYLLFILYSVYIINPYIKITINTLNKEFVLRDKS